MAPISLFKRPGDERQVLGEHYPKLKYYRDAAAFDALGPGGAATKDAMADIPMKDSPKAIDWPYTYTPPNDNAHSRQATRQ